jgi:hypothetical protein
VLRDSSEASEEEKTRENLEHLGEYLCGHDQNVDRNLEKKKLF